MPRPKRNLDDAPKKKHNTPRRPPPGSPNGACFTCSSNAPAWKIGRSTSCRSCANESYYFAPRSDQVMTRVWPTYWPTPILMTRPLFLFRGPVEIILTTPDHHSGNGSPHPPRRLQPYTKGASLFRDHRRPGGTRQFGQGVRGGRPPPAKEYVGQGPGSGAEDLRGPPASYNDVNFHRRIHDPRVHREAQVLPVRPQPPHRPLPHPLPRPARINKRCSTS